jgi:hypothetical protein
MRMYLFIPIVCFLATGLLCGQEPAIPKVPVPAGKPLVKGAIRVPLGVRESKPAVPSVEALIEKSREASVRSDRAWIVIEHAGKGGMSVIDLAGDGHCYLMERAGATKSETSSWIVRTGNTIPRAITDNMMQLASRKSVLFGVGGRRLLSRVDSGNLRLGVAANNGRSVHTSRPAALDQYPPDFMEGVLSLLAAARTLPLTKSVRGMVRAEFIDPRQARRLTVLDGRTLVAVRDPGRDATVLPPAVAAARMPGRRVAVDTEEDWKRILSYLSGGTGQINGDHCLISLGAHTYRLFVEPLSQ